MEKKPSNQITITKIIGIEMRCNSCRMTFVIQTNKDNTPKDTQVCPHCDFVQPREI